MIKQHYETGINYLCVTSRKDYISYGGSGTLWKRLKSKHPSEIKTILLFESENVEKFNFECLKYSVLFDVVDNEDFANLIPELGIDFKNNLNLYWEFLSDEEKREIILKRKKSVKETYKNKGIPMMHEARLVLNEYCKKMGVKNIAQLDYIKEKASIKWHKTLNDRYGVDHNMQIPGIAKKVSESRKKTMLVKYGKEYYSQIGDNGKDIAIKREKTLMEKYGYSNPSQIPEFKQKISENIKKTFHNRKLECCKFCSFESKTIKQHENFCENNPNRKIRKLDKCIYCDVLANPANIKRWHNDNCKKKGKIYE